MTNTQYMTPPEPEAPPLEWDELQDAPTASQPGGNGKAPKEDLPQPGDLTDTGNSERLVKLFSNRLRYVGAWGWLLWDGRRWLRDKNGQAMLYAKDTARSIYREASEATSNSRARDLARWAGTSLSRPRLEAMLFLTRSELATDESEFDNDPRLFSTENCVIELDTGRTRPHDPRDNITKMSGCEYNPAATCPTWEAFLNRIMDGDREMINFLQRAAGYTLTGSTGEQCLFFLYGSGANGKSTLLNALLDVMGEYGRQAAPSLLLQGDRHPTEIAALQGARMVATIEVAEGKRMAEVLVKQMTGGDRMAARFMHSDFFEFTPSFKIWLAANHMPDIRGTDNAIWRRIHLIPFDITLPVDERDPNLGAKLRGELPGILAWAVRGALEWHKNGLNVPAKVKQATAEYRAVSDLVGQFLEEECIESPMACAFAGDLYTAYRTWAAKNGADLLTQNEFSARMKERGYASQRVPGDGRKQYRGIGLKSRDDYDQTERD